jgi:hypothetical protein
MTTEKMKKALERVASNRTKESGTKGDIKRKGRDAVLARDIRSIIFGALSDKNDKIVPKALTTAQQLARRAAKGVE